MGSMFKGKVALVTAGASGIGRATAHAFAREGAAVMVSDIDEGGGRSVASEISTNGGTADFMVADVTDEAAVQSLVEGTVRRFGGLDYAHNNAGNMRGTPTFGDYSLDDWDYTLDVSLKSTWLCMRAQIAIMLARGGGVIVNTTSMAGVRTSIGANAAYSAAKAGVISLTEYAAVTYAKNGIRVNAVAPGLVRTAVVERLYTKEVQNKMASQTQPIGRIIEPEEIAHSVIFLCSDSANMITGMTLPVAGGYNAA